MQPRLGTLHMLRTAAAVDKKSHRRADDQMDRIGIAVLIAPLCDGVHKLVRHAEQEVRRPDLGDRRHPGQRSAERHADDRVLGHRAVQHAPFSIGTVKIFVDNFGEKRAGIVHALADQEHVLIFSHFVKEHLADALTQCKFHSYLPVTSRSKPS